MNRQPDKLFRDKLHGYQKPASREAWKKISQNLHQKNHRVLWLKIAASILLLACAGVLIFSGETRRPTAVLSEKVIPPSNQKQGDPENIIPGKSVPAEEQKQASSSPVNRPWAKSGVSKKANEQRDPTPAHQFSKVSDEEVPYLAVNESENEIPEADKATEDKSSETAGTSPEKINERVGRVTIVYSAKEVNEKYLNKKLTAEATSEEKESSTFRKLLDKAYDLKHNQDPLGDLRQMKNEILALNFKNEKPRSEND